MELNQALEAISRDSNTNQTLAITTKGLKNLKHRDSIDALDLIGDKVQAEEIIKAEKILSLNYGVDYPKEKFSVLWDMIKEDGWTNERLKATTKNFLKTKKFATWTIADWYDYGVKLFSYSKYLEELNKKGTALNNEIEWFKIDGVSFWRYIDNLELPEQLKDFKSKPSEGTIQYTETKQETGGYDYMKEFNQIYFNETISEPQRQTLISRLNKKFNV